MVNKFKNCVFDISYLSKEEHEKFSYKEFVDKINKLGKKYVSDIRNINVYPNGDNTMNILCGVAPMWKEHENKVSFEYYYRISEMKRALYANEYEADGEPAYIYIEIDGKKFVVNWQSTLKDKEKVEDGIVDIHEIYDDTFTYREASMEELGILNVLADATNTKNTPDDEYKMIKSPNFIIVYDENIPLKQFKEIYNRMNYHGYAQQNVKFNVEL